MVNIPPALRRIQQLCIIFAAFMVLRAAASPVSNKIGDQPLAHTGEAPVPPSTLSYKIGDKAQEDILATAPCDVVDEPATAALKASKARTIGAIYRRWDGITNTIASQFLITFSAARANFSNALVQTYHQPVIDKGTIAAPDFGYFLTAYNIENKKFPVTPALAAAWARGDSGAELRDKWLGLLLQTMSGPVQPNTLPPHFLYQKKIRMLSVTNLNQQFTYVTAWRRGYIISADKVPALSRVRSKFLKEFSANEQPLAAALSHLLQPNCTPEVALTEAAREYSVREIVATIHFTPGQVIVRRGAVIDANAIVALDMMNKELVAAGVTRQAAADHESAQQQQEQLQNERAAAKLAQLQAQNEKTAAQLAQQQREQEQLDRERAESQARQDRLQAAAMQAQMLDAQLLARKLQTRDEWLAAAVIMVAVVTLLGWWRVARRHRTLAAPAPARLQRMEKNPPALPPGLAPYLAQTLREAVVQGLAAQRAELLDTQRTAAMEIAELVDRLDKLQAPMQERLRAYQERIQELERDLSERTAENRELLKLKIEMMHRQIEVERGRVKLN